MIVGVPREIKPGEQRVALTPAGAHALVGAGHRVICPDLAGFGRSDKPTDTAWYTYDRHVALMTTLLNERLDVRDATIVVQDWGGPIGLRWAMENRDRVKRLVILNTGLFTGRVSQGFMAWRDFAEKVGRDLPVARIIDGATKSELAPEVIAAYDAPFPGPEAKAGAAMFPLLVPLDADAPGAREMAWTLEELRAFDGEVLVAFSDSDPVFPFPKSGQVFCDLLPQAGEQVRIENAAHFLQEDAGEQIAAAMIERFGHAAGQ